MLWPMQPREYHWQQRMSGNWMELGVGEDSGQFVQHLGRCDIYIANVGCLTRTSLRRIVVT